MADLLAPRVLLIDVDGTLVDYQARLPADAAAAVAAALVRGHRLYLCTGRSRAEIYPELWELGVHGLIGGNGSYVEDQGQVVFHQTLDPAVVQQAVEWMLDGDLGFYLEANSGLYGSDNLPAKAAALLGEATPENIQRVRDGFPHMIYGTRSGRDDVNKISFVLEPWVDLEWLRNEYDGVAAIDSWSLTGTGPEFGEFGQLGIDKGRAVGVLAEHLGVGTEEFIAFGDALPDRELLRACGTAVAMGNAPDALKQVATLVTERADEGGLANAFRRLGLVE